MKIKLFSLLMVVALLMAGVGTSVVEAGAYDTNFTTSITYQNVGTADAVLSLQFYAAESGTPISIALNNLAPLAGRSVYVGSLGAIGSGFEGSAVLSSSQPLAATLVQIADASSGIKVRPVSNGFTGGSAYVLVPTAIKQTFNSNSIISVQNVDSVGADLAVTFVPVSGAPIPVAVTNLPAYATKFFDLNILAGMPATFNGSVQINAVKTGTATPGKVIASSMELGTGASTAAYAFEGTSMTATKIFMPSALCKYSGVQDSFYAVQNTSAASVDVTVNYSGGGTSGAVTVLPGAKKSFNACSYNAAGYIGSAVIEATGQIVAMGKITGGGLSTAFLGFTAGSQKVALPYVRYTNAHWTDGTGQRAYIAIQNIGAAELPASSVSVKYYDKNGVLVGTHTIGTAIPVGEKKGSSAQNIGALEFGSYPDGSFGGSAVVEGPAGSQLAVIVRVVSYLAADNLPGEDYSGIALP